MQVFSIQNGFPKKLLKTAMITHTGSLKSTKRPKIVRSLLCARYPQDAIASTRQLYNV